MKIDVPLEIGDVVWIIDGRKTDSITINGVNHYENNEIIHTKYILKRYGDRPIDKEYFLSEKDAEIEIARRILEGLKDES